MANVLINWSDVYVIGHDIIDKQHEKLVNIINKLYDAFLQGNANDIVGEVLQEMLDYTKEHFVYEEEVLRKMSYPKLKEHIKIHEGFVEKVKGYLVSYEKGKSLLSYEIMNVLRKWLMEHIGEEDKLYVKYLK